MMLTRTPNTLRKTAATARNGPATTSGSVHVGLTRARLPFANQARTARGRSSLVVRATNETTAKEQEEAAKIKQFSENIGLPTDEGIFGFKPFAEIWVGRLAMGGFISSILVEFFTGRGTLQQLGLITPSLPLFATILGLAGGATTIASWRTILRASDNKMTANELVRYRQFLGIQNEEKNIAETRSKGSPADRFLGSDDNTNAQSSAGAAAENAASDGAAESQAKSEGGLYSKDDVVTQKQFANEGMAYARDVEVNNGRWAMLGFLSALLVEAGTGKGILGQVIAYLKFVGLLGEKSGF